MKTGPLLYVVILGMWRSSHLQVKGSTFISQLFKDIGYSSGLIWSQKSTKCQSCHTNEVKIVYT